MYVCVWVCVCIPVTMCQMLYGSNGVTDLQKTSGIRKTMDGKLLLQGHSSRIAESFGEHDSKWRYAPSLKGEVLVGSTTTTL
uniref:Putative secreted protein n=1 Tax=Anopheles darlingi TaxID=43151 RepID=A0A2M4DF67_ANODA